MSSFTLNGQPIGVGGFFPQIGDVAPSFNLVNLQFEDVSSASFAGKRKVIQVLPTLELPFAIHCVQKLGSMAINLPNTVVLIVTADTPYAQARIAKAENFQQVTLLSTLRGRDFHKNFGVMVTGYPIGGLMATALVAIDEADQVVYADRPSEIFHEPNYAAALRVLG